MTAVVDVKVAHGGYPRRREHKRGSWDPDYLAAGVVARLTSAAAAS